MEEMERRTTKARRHEGRMKGGRGIGESIEERGNVRHARVAFENVGFVDGCV
jgi:hypothetical protein